MWGFGGKYYWRRKERGKVEGIVVVFSWLSSQEKYLNNYINLYSSLGWNSLVCPSQFLNLFFSDKAEALALQIVNVLVKELKIKPCPIVFASFSGGPKACMYKVLQIIEHEKYQLVKDCVSGHIFDSTPVDFTSDLGTRFVLHPSILKLSKPPVIISWIANGISSSLDALFLTKFEEQRAEYWQTLYSSISFGASYLIFCSENDDLAPCKIICNFAQRLKGLGADVRLVKWNSSSHVGHYKNYPEEYKSATSELLKKASLLYLKRIQQLESEKMGLDVTFSSNKSFKRVALKLNDYSSMEFYEGSELGSLPNEDKERFIPIPSPRKIRLEGVLGQILFDVCVPKDVEDWDMKIARRHMPFNPMKCIRRSRL